jgi:alkanesulfonate monooxygenase SsuD/methylene tetrahydromethanopterin reductase-like flavin-dependent oxidoreductase (luciferase family)
MEFGAHLPLISFQGERRSLTDLLDFTRTAEEYGYAFLAANDHFIFSRPWLDGPTALAAVLANTDRMRLATTVTIPVVRGLVQTAKTLAAIDLLSADRLTVGLGPGSSQRDYALVGVPFDERWKRLDEIVPALRALWDAEAPPVSGQWYETSDVELEPRPARPNGPPLWIGSWGSPAGLRRVARLGDGWLASGYNTTPLEFARAHQQLQHELRARGRDADGFPNAIATMWTYITEDQAAADRLLTEVVAPMLRRPIEVLKNRLPIGSAEFCAETLAPYATSGAQYIFIWPIADEQAQLERFQERVVPLINARIDAP